MGLSRTHLLPLELVQSTVQLYSQSQLLSGPKKRSPTMIVRVNRLLHLHILRQAFIPMKDMTGNRRVGRSPSKKGRLGRTLVKGSSGNPRAGIQTSPVLPRASSRINDNHCYNRPQGWLLAGSTHTEHSMNISHLNVNLHVVTSVPSAPGHSQRKGVSPGVSDCHIRKSSLKYVKGVSCVTQLPCVNPVKSVSNVAPNPPVGARLQKFWQTWLHLGAGPKVVQILREGYTLPFQHRPKLARFPTVVSCYVNPLRNSYLLEALHQLMDKNAIELVKHKTSLSFFNRLFLVPKPDK